MLVYAISDQHGLLPEIEEAHDLLLIGGDICPVDDHTVEYQRDWLDTEFRAWLEQIPAKRIVGVAGNHDMVFDIAATYRPIFEPLRPPGIKPPDDLPWTYLQDQSVIINGYKIHGTPWQPIFFNWAFNLDEEHLAEKFQLIDDDVNILISHGPPQGYGDLTSQGVRVGSSSLLAKIKEVKPELVVCGHIHEAHGSYDLAEQQTKIVNATIVDLAYQNVYLPTRLELPDRNA